MSLRVKTNAMSAHAMRQMHGHTSALQDSTSKLASGQRINQAADDAAGLAISENLRAKIRSLSAAQRNSLDALSILEVSESGFVETANMLVRLRELAVQASSDTVGPGERNYLDREFVALKDEIDRIAASVMYNGVRLVTGMPDPPDNSMKSLQSMDLEYPMEFQIDANFLYESDSARSANPVHLVRFDTKNLVAYTSGRNSLALGENTEGARLNSKVAAHNSIDMIDRAISKVNEHRSFIGSTQAKLKDIMQTIAIRIENSTVAKSRIADTDFASEAARYAYFNIQQQATSSVMAASNINPERALSLLERGDNRVNIISRSIIARSL